MNTLRAGSLILEPQCTAHAAEMFAVWVPDANWRRGIGKQAVEAMLSELAATYRVHACLATLKQANYRSLALLRGLGFEPYVASAFGAVARAHDEITMLRVL